MKTGSKTASSKRKYRLLPEIKEILKSIPQEQKKNQKLFGREYQKTDYVFTWPDGKLYRPGSVTRGFQRVLAKNNFVDIL